MHAMLDNLTTSTYIEKYIYEYMLDVWPPMVIDLGVLIAMVLLWDGISLSRLEISYNNNDNIKLILYRR